MFETKLILKVSKNSAFKNKLIGECNLNVVNHNSIKIFSMAKQLINSCNNFQFNCNRRWQTIYF